MRRIIFFLLLVVSYWLLVTPIFAADEFETGYNVRYEVNVDGRVHVSQEISLKNNLSSVYATRYSLSLQSGKIENITASDKLGPLKTEVQQKDGTTIIDLFFNEQVVGVGKTYVFTIAYDIFDLAQKNGQVWEIYLPKLANSEKDADYNIFLIVPQAFGDPAFINPEPIERKIEENYHTYRFAKNQLLGGGVSAAFGQFQIFDFTLNYYLENPNLSLGETEIALPPDTAFQQLSYSKIDPPPLRVRIDPDGNWLALFRLKPAEKMSVSVAGKAKIFATPQPRFSPRFPFNLEKNLWAAEYWEIDHPLIKNTAKNLKNPKAIYDFVLKTLEYDFERVTKEGIERKGAASAIISPKNSICMEFTDLFIALTRAAGIPAREVNGYAYTTDQKLQPLSLVADILHSWPEYWDEAKKSWIPVDPTWEKTTGGINYFSKTDLNHFAFAIHGESSTQPPPAGSYRDPSIKGKDVLVTFGRYEQEEISKIEIEFKIPKRIFWRKEVEGEILVKNPGPRALYDLKVALAGERVAVSSKDASEVSLIALPPFGEEKIPLKIKAPGWLDYGQGVVKILANGQEFQTRIEVGLMVRPLIFFTLGTVFLVGFWLTFMIKSKRKSTHG